MGTQQSHPPPPPTNPFPYLLLLTSSLVACLSLAYLTHSSRPRSSSASSPMEVVLVGCGLPKKSMGWCHLQQLLSMPGVRVVAVVEPFLLGTLDAPPASFKALQESLSPSVAFAPSLASLPDFSASTLVLICGRTADNPLLLEAAIDKGARCVYLEKPGAPTVAALERMKNISLSRTVPCRVFLGYNKQVARYVEEALAFAATEPGSTVEFIHHNSYGRGEELAECFERNAEGLLKNMAIHELALLVTFFDVRVDTLFKVEVDRSRTELLTIKGRSDFSSLSFTVTTLAGRSATVTADRCAGNLSYAVVSSSSGKEAARFSSLTLEEQAEAARLGREDPEVMPYFHTQGADYLALKTRVVDAFRTGGTAGSVATIDVGIEALKLAEFITRSVTRQLADAE
ncbi:hypothetical protein TeGR_g5715 [Tetraparma gracilis]|uniref:Gfo/Idh/MocA-like oxidoreductase N-terminal domain-containing protein n=1 Tax=Tetraparma gracilis TaxID=2962635 RepID=A0ABQ6MQK8_9STRA|nr:hypothetical protein TeGR_g5715 [Tetraparma gracilis]